MLLEALLLYFLANFGETRPQDASTDRPQPSRPFYRPNPTYELISQLIPPGEPWPANAEDYGTFSQTKPPNYTPVWATNPTIAPTTSRTTTTTKQPPRITTVNAINPCLGPSPSPSPVPNLEDRLRETERPGDYGWLWPGEDKVSRRNEASANPMSASEPVRKEKETDGLFTSAPAVLHVRIDDDEPKLENVFPANLIPENDNVGSLFSTEATTVTTSKEVVKLVPQEQQQIQQAAPVEINEFFKK